MLTNARFGFKAVLFLKSSYIRRWFVLLFIFLYWRTVLWLDLFFIAGVLIKEVYVVHERIIRFGSCRIIIS